MNRDDEDDDDDDGATRNESVNTAARRPLDCCLVVVRPTAVVPGTAALALDFHTAPATKTIRAHAGRTEEGAN